MFNVCLEIFLEFFKIKMQIRFEFLPDTSSNLHLLSSGERQLRLIKMFVMFISMCFNRPDVKGISFLTNFLKVKPKGSSVTSASQFKHILCTKIQFFNSTLFLFFHLLQIQIL